MATAPKHSTTPPLADPAIPTAALISLTSDTADVADKLLGATNVDDTDDADTDPIQVPASSSLNHLIRATLHKATTATVHLSNESPFRHLYCQCKHHLVMQACSEAASAADAVAGCRSQFDGGSDAVTCGHVAAEHDDGASLTTLASGKEHQH